MNFNAMKNILLTIILITISLNLMAHEGGHGVPLKDWTLESKKETFKADFIKYDQNEVWLNDQSHRLLKFSFSGFSAKDQKYILDRHEVILSLNNNKASERAYLPFSISKIWLILFGGALLLFSTFQFIKRKKRFHLTYGILGTIVILLVSCSKDDSPEIITTSIPSNDISFMQSIFGSFATVSTTSDATYFYVASNGLPSHNMMVGITNWQQQVPIDHNYTGNNSWAIPIQPELADNPLSTQTNLLKGAIAIAANGIPIFNPLNNRGEDANAIGELDQWGGHCGRADDYHYHLPPTHLQTTVGSGMPIAYAVDGFPVYGETTEQLDEYLGKFNSDGSYQYHTITEYPYFIAGMRGEVTLDPSTTAPENQVIPQAMTQGVRPALEPLASAEIIAFQSTGANSYSLTYTHNSENYTINYSWDSNDLYTYEFVNPNGTTVETFQR